MIFNSPCDCRLALVAGLGLLIASAPSAAALGQERGAALGASLARIDDGAIMFDSRTLDEVQASLRAWADKAGLPVTIETIESLGGRPIEETAIQKARLSRREGLYVLIARKDRRIDVAVSNRFRGAVGDSERKAIQDAFIKGLQREGPDAGLRDGARAIEQLIGKLPKRVDDNVLAGSLPPSGPAVANGGASPLVVRNQARLTIAGAREILAGAEAQAATMGLKVNIAIVDDGGHLLAFERMDGARPASGYTAMTKATTAATFRQETGPLPRGGAEPDILLNLSLQNAAQASGGKVTTLFGGVPVLVDGQVIGGVGVGGGTGEQDATVARAGIASLNRRLREGEAPQQP